MLLLANPGFFDIRVANYWAARRGMQVEPLVPIWDRLGFVPSGESGAAFWGIKR